jgi:hypothetical protein
MSDSSGKKIGGVAGVVAAIGLLFAKAGGSCAHVGVGGAKLAAPAAGMIDDGARLGLAGRGAGALDDGARFGLAGRNARMLPVGAADDAFNGARAGGHSLEETLIHDGADITLEIISFGVDDDDDVLVDPSSAALTNLKRTMSKKAAPIPSKPSRGQKMGLLPLVDLGESVLPQGGFIAPIPAKTEGKAAFLASIGKHRNLNPLVFIGKAASHVTGMVLPNGFEIADEAIHRRCMELGKSCVLLACESSPAIPADEREGCTSAAFALWQRSVRLSGGSPGAVDAAAFVAPILEGRPSQRGGFALVVSRLDVSGSTGAAPRILRSRIQEKAPAAP